MQNSVKVVEVAAAQTESQQVREVEVGQTEQAEPHWKVFGTQEVGSAVSYRRAEVVLPLLYPNLKRKRRIKASV